jgi:filamentous hemagglutinin family protein
VKRDAEAHSASSSFSPPWLRLDPPALPRLIDTLRTGPFAAMTALAALMLILPQPVAAQSPAGGNVVAGSASISQAGPVTNINQSSQKAVINWQGFSVGAQNTVNFNQPNSSAATLNRVIGNERSVIDGVINANGQVFIVNSAGVLFGKGSQVNVGGLVASTLDIANNDFMAGRYNFSGTSAASVVNQGHLRATGGGYVTLLGKTVANDGVISARLGTVAMSSGEKITLNFEGNSLLDVTIDQGTLNALVENKRAIRADGGRVILTAKAADQLLSAQVNNTGLVQARTVAALKGGAPTRKGNITINAQGGIANIDGKLDASAPKGGDGGFVETSGERVKIADSAVIITRSAAGNAGTWLIDPTDFNIVAGSGAQTASGIGADTLKANLANTNVSIVTTAGGNDAGDININAPLDWSVASGTLLAHSLTLSAHNNINVNAPVLWTQNTITLNSGKNVFVNNAMTASNTANFIANYGRVINNDGSVSATPTAGTNGDGSAYGLYTYQGGTNLTFAGKVNFSGAGSLSLNGEGYIVINDINGLLNARSTPSESYAIGADFGGVTAANWTTALDNGVVFTGKFNGLGHVITSFTTTATSLFGTIGNGAVVSNIGLTGPTVNSTTTPKIAGGIFADINQGNIINSFSGGTLNNTNIDSAGGLVGINSGWIAQSYFLGTVNAAKIAGGLVGINTASGTIVDSSARAANASQQIAGTLDTITYTGGFVGVNDGVILRSYAQNRTNLSGAAIATGSVAVSGGFVGLNTKTIDQSYSAPANTGSFQAGRVVAGFVGENAATGVITNSYTTSVNVNFASATWDAGFVYRNAGKISNAYVIGYALGTKQRYGFVFDNTGGTIQNSYWSATEASGAAPVIDSSPATRLTVAEGTSFASYANFDTAIWGAAKSGQPILRNILLNISNTATIYGNATSNIASLNLTAQGLQGGDSVTNAAASPFNINTDYVDAGIWTPAGLLASSPYANMRGVITVSPRTLTFALSDLVSDKVYDGTTTGTVRSDVSSDSLVGMVDNQTLNLIYTSATFTNKNVGQDKSVILTYTVADGLNGGKALNYIIPTATIASITPRPVSASVVGLDKVYDGTTSAAVSTQLPGKVSGDNISVSYTGAVFADRNAGQSKTIVVSGLTLTGADAGNYTLINTAAQTSANITARPVDIAGSKAADGNSSIAATNLTVMNAAAGDNVQLGGTALLSSSAEGVSSIVNLTSLTLNNPNYTMVGSVGSVVVGGHNLILSQVVSGAASVVTAGSTTTVMQTTDKAILDWQRFSIAAGETLTFVQPAATSITLNRVIGNEVSVIAGALNANGRVFIINSAGVLFAAGSSVNVGALVASTLNVSNSDFNAGNYLFTAAGSGSVVAKGDIVVVDGGFFVLASGNAVSHKGSLTARGGKALLVGANSLTLNLNTADRGLNAYALANLTGAITAGGSINVAASGGGSDGLLETAGKSIAASGLTLNTGTNGLWSWTQNAIVIGAGGDLSGSFLGTQLGSRNMSLNALTGDITLNDTAVWSSDTALTLAAANNININAPLVAVGDHAGLAMVYGGDYNIRTRASYSGTVLDANGQPVAKEDTSGGVYGSITLSGAYASLKINGNAYTLIHSMSDLDLLDKGNSATGMYYNPTTGLYDTPIPPKLGSQPNFVTIWTTVNGTLYYYNPVTGAYDIPTTIQVGSVTKYYNPGTGAYDLSATYSGPIIRYDLNLATGKYVVEYDVASGKYFDPSTGTYHLDTRYPVTTNYFDPATAAYKAGYDPASGKYFDPATGGYTSTTAVSVPSYYYFNPTTGHYDLNSPYAVTGRYALAQDLNAAGTTYVNSPIESFSGTLTGLGHTISNLKIDNPATASSNSALIGTSIPDTVLRDIGLLNVDITGRVNGGFFGVGALLGFGSATISHAYSTGQMTASGTSGGLVGGDDGATSPVTISDSFSEVSFSGSGFGGLIGRATYATIVRSHATGNMTVPSTGGGSMGGLISYAANTNVYDSYATGSLTGNASSSVMGGLIGNVATGSSINVVKNSFATGNITGSVELGGLIGALSSTLTNFIIDNSYATGNIISYQNIDVTTTPGIGGLVGYANSGSFTIYVKNSHATGDVSALGTFGNGTGGLMGYISGKSAIDRSYATGDVIGIKGTGGLVGAGGSSNISNSYATGNVKGGLTVGGLAGSNSGTIRNSYATGDVTGTDNNVGGLVGSNVGSGTIIGSYATGNVTGLGANSSTGGLVGTNTGYITHSYSAGLVTGPSGLTGALAGVNFGSGNIANSWYNSSINPGTNPVGSNTVNGQPVGKLSGGGGLNSGQMKDVKYYANGTINQVLADRAAAMTAAKAAAEAAAFRAEAIRSGNVIATTNPELTSAAPPPAVAEPQEQLKKTVLDAALRTIEEGVRADDQRRARARNATARRGADGSRGGGFGATIRSIDVDGQRFNLQNGAPEPGAPAGGAPEPKPQ